MSSICPAARSPARCARAPLLFADLPAEQAALAAAPDRFGNMHQRSRAWMGIPPPADRQRRLAWCRCRRQPGRYGPADLELLERLGDIVGAALEIVDLAQQQRAEPRPGHARGRAHRRAGRPERAAAELVEQRLLPELLDHALALIMPPLGMQGGGTSACSITRPASW
ncbi:MAG: hypothetical protein U0Z44_17020 [Kouleothrix sp.]